MSEPVQCQSRYEAEDRDDSTVVIRCMWDHGHPRDHQGEAPWGFIEWPTAEQMGGQG